MLRRNTIYENGGYAIYVHDGGGGTFEGNDLRNNVRGAWSITDDSKSLVNALGNIE
jgi:parallel beta-helix repeat protein